MKILAIDTTNKQCSVSVKNIDTITNYDLNEITHSEKLLPLINKTLVENNLNINDIQLMAVTNGPGSFTGVRIGVSTIKALSHKNDIKIIAISSLELMAFEYYFKNNIQEEKYICSMLDAKNDRAYYGVFKLFRINNDIVCEKVYEISSDDISTIINNVSTYDNLTFVTDKVNLNNICINNENPDSKYLIKYIENVINYSHNLYNTFNLDVLYARPSQAERIYNGKEN